MNNLKNKRNIALQKSVQENKKQVSYAPFCVCVCGGGGGLGREY